MFAGRKSRCALAVFWMWRLHGYEHTGIGCMPSQVRVYTTLNPSPSPNQDEVEHFCSNPCAFPHPCRFDVNRVFNFRHRNKHYERGRRKCIHIYFCSSESLQGLHRRHMVGVHAEQQVRTDWPNQSSHVRPRLTVPHPLGLEKLDPRSILCNLLKCSVVRQKSQ